MNSTGEVSEEKHEGSTALATLWWLLGLFSVLAMGGGSIWLSHVDVQLQEMQQEQRNKIAKIATLEEKVNNTERSLDRIEDKLDKVLNRLR